jgi:dTDP-4-amino-4,6-dideoxygalactose transaminase
MSNICAGIGRGQMEVLDSHVNSRREMHDFYSTIFKNSSNIKLFTEPSEDFFSNHWLSAVLINSNEISIKKREDLRLTLEKKDIESRPLWKPMHLQPVFKNAPYYGGEISEKLYENGLCLPSGSNLKASEKDRIKECLMDFSIY